jgi:hypothetical protein
MNRQVLALDVSGTPRRWVSAEDAVAYYARSLVAWEYGETAMLFRGGWRRDGERSAVRVSSIIAVRGREFRVAGGGREPLLTNEKLFERDRCVCAYCGGRFRTHQLSREHVVPVSRGGTDSWKNLVSACRFFGPFEPRVRSRRPRRLEFLGLSRSRRRRGAHELRPRVDWRTQ